MTHLQRLEADVLTLHNGLSLRPTLETARRLGELLVEAKVPHGGWLPWLRRVKLAPRTAQLYMQVGNANLDSHLPEGVTLKRFLTFIRQARRDATRAERDALRKAMAGADHEVDESVRVHHADCRAFDWPDEVDVVATDPPWAEASCYSWLASWAASRLRVSGLLLVQCGTGDMADRIGRFTSAGLAYRWTLAIVHDEGKLARRMYATFGPSWRPVLVFSRGRLTAPGKASDTYTVRPSGANKAFHDWQQPLAPWVYWLERLTRPGDVIADPFAGAGTIGVAIRDIGGGRQYIGTEADPRHARVAAARLADPSVG